MCEALKISNSVVVASGAEPEAVRWLYEVIGGERICPILVPTEMTPKSHQRCIRMPMERAEIGLWFDLDTGNVASAISDSRAYTFSGQFLAVSLLTSLGPYSALKRHRAP